MDPYPNYPLIVMLIGLSCVSNVSTSFQTSLWRQSENGAVTLTKQLVARSLIECTSLCSKLDGCDQVCFDTDVAFCYVKDNTVASVLAVNDVSTRCFVQVAITMLTARCPTELGYQQVGDRCGKMYSDSKTWQDASDYCQAEKAHLYFYRSHQLDRPLIDHLGIQLGIYTDYTMWRIWVGAYDLDQNQTFVWLDGSSLPTASEVWFSGAPDPVGNEYCVDITIIFNFFGLIDDFCGSLWWFVCQVDL